MTGPDVKALRQSLGATHQQFADALGTHKSQINRWEREGVDGMRAKLLGLIAAKPQVWKWLLRLPTSDRVSRPTDSTNRS